MRSFIYFSLLLFIFFAVPHKSDLSGHWHVYPLGKSKLGGISYTVLEIDQDGTGVFGASNYERGFSGDINIWKKTMEFGGECRVLDFNFKYAKNGLILEQQEYGGTFLATKCGEDCCDKQQDFFAYQKKVNIDLPIAKDTTLLFLNKIPSFLENRLLYGLSLIHI